jgi:(R)-amidase
LNNGGIFYNTSVLVTPDGIALRYRKTHLWPSERGLFQPGDRYVTALWKGVRVGILICYDIEHPESARALGQLGAELILVTNGNMDPYGPVHRTYYDYLNDRRLHLTGVQLEHTDGRRELLIP